MEAAKIAKSDGADHPTMVPPADFNIDFSTSDSLKSSDLMTRIHYLPSVAAAPSPAVSMKGKVSAHYSLASTLLTERPSFGIAAFTQTAPVVSSAGSISN